MIGNMLVGHLIHQQQELFESYIIVTEGDVCKSLHPVASVDTVHHPVLVEVPVIYEFEVRYLFQTGVTRKTIVAILAGMAPQCFGQFKHNPEEFIQKASKLINDEKATVIIQHITYNKLEETFGTDIFTEPTMKGKLGVNAMQAEKHLYDYLIFDSPSTERPFAEKLDARTELS